MHKVGKLPSSLSSPSLAVPHWLQSCSPVTLKKESKNSTKEITKEPGLPFQCTLSIVTTRKSPSCSSEPCAHSIQNAHYPLTVYTLIFLIWFFCTLAFMWFEVKSLFKVLVFWEEKLDFQQEVESISDNQMDKSIFCCPPKQIRIKGLDFLPQTSLSSSRQLSCIFLHKGNFCLQIGNKGHPPNLLRSQIHWYSKDYSPKLIFS